MSKQLSLDLNKGSWGGRRPKAGRKRIHSKGVAHRKRVWINSRNPLHVNFKYRVNIRNKDILKILKKALINSRRKGLRILHYSIQSNHMHFIVEADDNLILESGMRSLTVTIAKGIKKGKVQLERYHLHVLKTLRETRNAIYYVLFNEQRHTGKMAAKIDSYSSAHTLDPRKLAKSAGITLLLSRVKIKYFERDQEKSYFGKKILQELLS